MHSSWCSITLTKCKQQSCNKRENKRVAKTFAVATSLRIIDYRTGCSARLHSFAILREPEPPGLTSEQLSLLSALSWA